MARENTHTKKTHRAVRERRATYKTASPHAEFKRVTRKQIDAVVQKIVDAFNPEKIILFGSYAYGKPNIDSDVDMLVVMESNERLAPRTSRVLGAILDVKTFPMDLLVRTPQELQHRLAIGDFFMREVIARGEVLYARRFA
jgi:predicted nucleotidyltransferase